MSDPHWPQLGGPESPGRQERPLYSQQLKVRIQKSERLNRNVLEINLENEKQADEVDDGVLAKLFQKVGITMSQVEGRQLVPKRMPRKVFVWFKEGVDLHQFCREECYRLTNGVKTGTIRPMDKKEVEVTITLVMEYLGLFGKIVKNVAVYVKIKEGPFEGLKNGDRKYMMDFTGGRNLGTYHLVDGANVHISYAGQRRTCGRCHKVPSACPGGGIARTCDERGGQKIGLREHMDSLWVEIGFKPADFTLENEDEESPEVEIRENQGFTPPFKNRPALSDNDKKNLTGISVRNLPCDIAEEQCRTFLESHGLPTGHTSLRVNRLKYSSTVDVEQLTAESCLEILNNLDEITAFDKKIYCKGIANLANEVEDSNENLENPVTVKDPQAPPAQAIPLDPTLNENGTQLPQNVQKPLPMKQVIPGLLISKTEEKKLKEKKKDANKKKNSADDDFVWQGLSDHPLYNKKRDAAAAALTPPEKTPSSRSKPNKA